MAVRNFMSEGQTVTDPVPAAVQTFATGEIVMIDASGYATPGATATGQLPGGVCEQPLDASGTSAGDLKVNVISQGDWIEVDNSTGADAVLSTDYNAPVYTLDRNAVSRLSAGKSKLGISKGLTLAGRVRVQIRLN